MKGITLVGLGPGDLSKLTLEARDILENSTEIWAVAPRHPVLASLMNSARLRRLEVSAVAASEDRVAHQDLVEEIMHLATRPGGVVVALPGHPLWGNVLGRELLRRAAKSSMPCHVVGASSPLDAALRALPADADGGIRLYVCTAASLSGSHTPPFPPDSSALITEVDSASICQELCTMLQTVYPRQHELLLFGREGSVVHRPLPLHELGRLVTLGTQDSLFIPPLGPGTSVEALQEVVAHLRSPEGCPWDRKQTHESLRPHLLEEAYEAIAAMDSGNEASLREELGDLLLQIMLNAQIAAEAGGFTLNDVARGIHDKLIRRHPHVFGNVDIRDEDGVLANWEKLKEDERAENGEAAGLLDGAPVAMPALSLAQEYQDRASRVGFDWPEISGVLSKISEEVMEVEAASDPAALEAELGDLLFSVVNFARWKRVDSESALRAANQRFARRFRFIEAAARRTGRRLSELSLEEMDAFWDQAKGAG